MPLTLFLKHQNQWSLRLSDQHCWVYKEKDTVTPVSLDDSYISPESCNSPSLPRSVLIQEWDNSLQRMGKEKLLKLHPASLSSIQFETFTINWGERWSNYFKTKFKKIQIKSPQKLRNFCLILGRYIWNKVCISSFTSLPLSHKFPRGVGMNFKSPLPLSINEYFLPEFKNVPVSLFIHRTPTFKQQPCKMAQPGRSSSPPSKALPAAQNKHVVKFFRKGARSTGSRPAFWVWGDDWNVFSLCIKAFLWRHLQSMQMKGFQNVIGNIKCN